MTTPITHPPTVLITGGTGFIGRATVQTFLEKGWRVLVVSRRRRLPPDFPDVDLIHWDPLRGIMDFRALNRVHVLIHLAGYPIFRVFVPGWKKKLWHSRVGTLRWLYEVWEGHPYPQTLISASAIGYYGDSHDHWLTETSPPGNHFLSPLVRAWEEAALLWEKRQVRVVIFRIGIVLDRHGGLFPMLETLARLRLLATPSHYDPYFSWIARQDVASSFYFAATHPEIQGIYNLVAPQPVRFSQVVELFRERRRWQPLLHRIPSGLIRTLGGPLGPLLLMSQRVSSQRWQTTGYSFQFPTWQQIGEYLLP